MRKRSNKSPLFQSSKKYYIIHLILLKQLHDLLIEIWCNYFNIITKTSINHLKEILYEENTNITKNAIIKIKFLKKRKTKSIPDLLKTDQNLIAHKVKSILIHRIQVTDGSHYTAVNSKLFSIHIFFITTITLHYVQ